KNKRREEFPRRVPALIAAEGRESMKTGLKTVQTSAVRAFLSRIGSFRTGARSALMQPLDSLAVVLTTSDRARETMAEEIVITTGIARHGASRLPSVEVDSFNLELKDDDGFLGDRASKGAFRKILDTLRKPLKKAGEDPLGSKSAQAMAKSELDEALTGEDVHAAALVHGAIEEFAQELAYVTQRFMKTKG